MLMERRHAYAYSFDFWLPQADILGLSVAHDLSGNGLPIRRLGVRLTVARQGVVC